MQVLRLVAKATRSGWLGEFAGSSFDCARLAADTAQDDCIAETIERSHISEARCGAPRLLLCGPFEHGECEQENALECNLAVFGRVPLLERVGRAAFATCAHG